MKQILTFLLSWIEYEIIGLLVVCVCAAFRPEASSAMDYLGATVGLALVYAVLAHVLKFAYVRVRANRPRLLTSYIMASKLGCLILSALLFLAVGLVGHHDMIPVAGLVVVLYLCQLVSTTLFYVRLEKSMTPQEKKNDEA